MNRLIAKIRNEVEQNGTIPFDRFMELALYDRDDGYYERRNEIGRKGDFFTSVSVGNLFGQLLAFQFAEWLDECGTGSVERGIANLQIIEAGAHDGKLAADILNWFKTYRPERFLKVDYCIMEASPSRRDWQRKTLTEFSEKVSWFNDWSDFARSELPVPRFKIIFSNELFDAMPVHRLGWDAQQKTWFEWGVSWDGEKLIWKRLAEIQSNVPIPELAPELLNVLPDGFSTEVCPAAIHWWSSAAQNLKNGILLAIDYGLVAEEFFLPERSRGTLRAYHQHRINADVLANPGEQDITSHVNFSALQHAGELLGLKTQNFVAQTKFLTGIAEQTWIKPQTFGEWDAQRCKQFQTLTHPEHLGHAFRVLIQSP